MTTFLFPGRYQIDPGMLAFGGQKFTAIRAAYWSPDSRRLLLYACRGDVANPDRDRPFGARLCFPVLTAPYCLPGPRATHLCPPKAELVGAVCNNC